MFELWQETIKPVLLPLYETFLEPLYLLFGLWSLAIVLGIIIATGLIHKALDDRFTKTRLGKDTIIIMRFVITFIAIVLGTEFIVGGMFNFTYILTLTLFTNIVAGIVYAGLKFLGIKEFSRMIARKLYKIAKKIDLPRVLAKEAGLPKFVVNKALEIVDQKIKESYKDKPDYTAFEAYKRKEFEISKEIEKLFKGLVKDEQLESAVAKFNKSLKDKLNK